MNPARDQLRGGGTPGAGGLLFSGPEDDDAKRNGRSTIIPQNNCIIIIIIICWPGMADEHVLAEVHVQNAYTAWTKIMDAVTKRRL